MSPSNRFPPTSRLTLALAALLLAPAGVSAAGKLAFAPASLDFGANALGEFKIKTATLKNGTAADIVLGAATLIDNPGGYSIAGTTCGATLPAGQSCKYILLYIAKTLPPAAARLELSTQDPDFPLLKLPLRANLYPALNDTGITRCGDANGNGLPCPVPDFPGQDAQYGRDKTRNAAGNGRAGFNFTKLDSKGKALPAKATAWDCVRDNVTGRVWEKKPKGDGTLGDQGLHDADDTYTWYSTDAGNNRGAPGYDNPGNTCFGYVVGQPATYCNTEAYVNRVNAAGWCGFTDWRLPDRFELLGLVDLSIPYPDPAIDTGYFPDTRWGWYWSSSPFAYNAHFAWYVSFGNGYSEYDFRNYYHAVRLVRGGQ
jgi:hypothetical protein